MSVALAAAFAHCLITGRLVRAPRPYTADGRTTVFFTLAVSNGVKPKVVDGKIVNGEYVEKTTYFDIIARNGVAAVAATAVQGQEVAVTPEDFYAQANEKDGQPFIGANGKQGAKVIMPISAIKLGALPKGASSNGNGQHAPTGTTEELDSEIPF